MKIVLQRLSFLSIIVLLSACVYVPVKQQFPDVPEGLKDEPKRMSILKYDTNFEGLLTTVVKNYEVCGENYIKLKAWQEWYIQQSEIYNKK